MGQKISSKLLFTSSPNIDGFTDLYLRKTIVKNLHTGHLLSLKSCYMKITDKTLAMLCTLRIKLQTFVHIFTKY